MMRERVCKQADWEDENVKELGYNPVVAITPDISTKKKKPPAEQTHTAAGERKNVKKRKGREIDDVHRRKPFLCHTR